MSLVLVGRVIIKKYNQIPDVCTVFVLHDYFFRMENNKNDRNDKNADKYIFFDILAFS